MARRIIITTIIVLALAQVAGAADYVLITLLHTNDIHGRVMPEGEPGLAKLATLVRGIRADMPNVLLIDAGDMIHETYENFLSRGLATISAMNAAGYNAATTGNHEYDFGLATLRGAVKAAAFPMLAANVRDRATGENWDGVLPYVIVSAGGAKIAILGLMTLDIVSLNWPPSIADIHIDDPIQTAKALVPELRRHVDVVVVLSHLGYDNDRRLAAAVPGIDFIIGSHSHTALDKWQWVGNTLVAQAGAYARYLGRIDFIVAVDKTGSRVVSVNGKDGRLWNELDKRPLDKVYPTSPLITVPMSVPDDEAVAAAYRPYRERTNAQLNEVIGEALDRISVIPSDSGESAAGNLVADAVRSFAKSDIGIVDAQSVEAGLEKGPIKLRNAFDLVGGVTREQIVVVRMKGSEVIAGLSAGLVKDGALRLQVSGATLTYRRNASGGAKITGMMVAGVPIDPHKDYTLAGQAYVIQGFMERHASLSVISESTETAHEAVARYIRSIKKVNPPETGRTRAMSDEQ